MMIFAIFGLVLQVIITAWLLIMHYMNGALVNLDWLLVFQSVISISCFIGFFIKKWTFTFMTSILSFFLFTVYLMKTKPSMLTLVTVIPLIIYFLVVTSWSSYKRKEVKWNKDNK